VTRPTTIKAITETPAKTPSPIGRTWIDFPGIANAAVVPVAPGEEAVEEASAAAADADAASMLEGPRTDTSVGATAAEELTPEEVAEDAEEL